MTWTLRLPNWERRKWGVHLAKAAQARPAPRRMTGLDWLRWRWKKESHFGQRAGSDASTSSQRGKTRSFFLQAWDLVQ